MHRIAMRDWAGIAAVWLIVVVGGLLLVQARAPRPEVIVPALALLATALPIAALMRRFDELAERLCRGDHALRTNLVHMRLTEELAGVGRWSIDLRSGAHEWSERACRIAGMDPVSRPSRAMLRRLLPDRGEQLAASLRHHSADREPYTIEFELCCAQGDGRRLVRAQAQNQFGDNGEAERILLVLRDVTDEYRALQNIRRKHDKALQAAEEARRLAEIDPLTGLANRRLAMRAIDKAILECRTTGEPFSLVVFDLDHFKRINDTHGRAAGDRVLVRVARIARAQAGARDLVGRIGGEEFVWLMPGADARAVRKAAERLRWAIEAGSSVEGVPGATASIGHATYASGDAGLTLFARADRALYAAKEAGRNQVRMAA